MRHQTAERRIDSFVKWTIIVMLAYAASIFAAALFRGTDMGAWVWDRHQNQFSWYSRPAFILPAAYYAYRRKLWYVIGLMAMLATSPFWFDAPASVPDAIKGYLDWEKEMFFTNESKLPLVALIGAVVLFLILLFYAFWQRNAWYGLGVINVGTVLKIIVSLAFGQEAGMAAIAPSLSSLAIINLAAWLWWRRAHR